MKKLIKSYRFWTALAGSIGLLAVSVGKVLGFDISASGVEEIVMAFCGVLIVFGVVKRPKKSKKEAQQNKEITCSIENEKNNN